MGAGGVIWEVSDEMVKEWTKDIKESPIRLGLRDTEEVAELPDDVEYNQEWWVRYCADNNLDVKSGKSLRGSSSRDVVRYEDLQDYLSF